MRDSECLNSCFKPRNLLLQRLSLGRKPIKLVSAGYHGFFISKKSGQGLRDVMRTLQMPVQQSLSYLDRAVGQDITDEHAQICFDFAGQYFTQV